ncbi:5'-nucleotidase, lipoprotein e(P4) family [Pseudoxanthomonas sacheonensis]|uniref:Acid phosphatase n=1 Tax=Pseudoxanthomonas sacheonensis TaxID=443615 RepID=A0ABU1RU88_9GAMM|nr:HAD family acid phosphatase [Pseudoxanthomonas sacheonensis]MDR6841490.1 acid phosphatase [Pseudoxanthomonas sacheonensis]
MQTKSQGVEDVGGTDEANAQRSREILYATLWMQHSTEYRAAALQAFESARAQLKTATKCGTAEAGQLQQSKGACGAKSPWAKRPAAIIFDLDETLLDNSAYQAFQIKHRELYDDARWETWVKSEEAMEIAGAVDFVEAASKVARIYYVSNRACRRPIDKIRVEQKVRELCPQLLDTMSRMAKLGFPKAKDRSAFYLKGMYTDLRSKEEIRQKIAAKHRIAMLVGDDLEDFVESRAVYAQNEAALAPLWGKRWFILPNPAYGSWPGVLSADIEQEVSKACDPLETKEARDRCAYRLRYETRLDKLKVWLPLE